MSANSSSAETDFFEVAARLNLLREDAEELREESQRTGVAPSELVVRRGLLDAVQVDIVETLRRPNDAIPGYEILDVLGRGAMGVVYRARQRNLDRIVALKTILVSQMSSPTSLERFEQEGRTVGKLRHPNIVAAFDLGRHAGRVFLAMEFVEGTDLERRIKRGGPLDETLVWHLARQTAGGLRHAAREGVVHRDVKPANLMLVNPPDGFPFPAGIPMVKIADFGLALLVSDSKPSTRLTTENTTLGSPFYMAPEQFESSNVGAAADVYALGATVYHALAGKPPFFGMTVTQIIGAKLTRHPDPLEQSRSGLAPQTYDLVARLMARDPKVRLADYAAVIHEIDEIIGNPVGTRSPSASAVDPASVTLVDTIARNSVSTSEMAAATDYVDVSTGVAPTGEHLAATTEPRARPRPVLEPDRPISPSLPSPRKFGPAVAAMLILLAVLGGLAIWQPWNPGPQPDPTPQRVAMRTVDGGGANNLFLGTTNGWLPIHGNWIVPVGESVLSGTDGIIGYVMRLGSREKPIPLQWYRLELILQPFTEDRNGAQEVHFGIEPGREVGHELDGPRYVVRRTREGVVVGTCPDNLGTFEPIQGGEIRPIDPEDDASIEIERNPGGWFLSVRGRSFAALPPKGPNGNRVRPEFRLRAEGGEAWFSDILFTQLEPK